MLTEIPPSGPWTGYYLYGYAGQRHLMTLHLTFTLDAGIAGEGVDDVARFTVAGRFDLATGAASWIKAYIGAHQVQYAGIYSNRSICGDWTLQGLKGGFWIWPSTEGQCESAAEREEIEHLIGGRVLTRAGL
jgi:hypothetical protein